jgi:ankyrin repeat protein
LAAVWRLRTAGRTRAHAAQGGAVRQRRAAARAARGRPQPQREPRARHLGWTPLHSAAGEGEAACVELLLQHGAQIDAADSEGVTALHRAASGDHVACAKLLLAHGTRLDPPLLTAEEKRTPLHYAARAGATAVAVLLVQSGLNPHCRDAQGA